VKIPSLDFRLHYIYIKPIFFVAYKVIFQNVNSFQAWHDRLSHPIVGLMRKIIGNSVGLDFVANMASYAICSEFDFGDS
jgi:hypothetical protein